MNHIAAAVEPLRADAMNRAEEYARSVIKNIHEQLEAEGWDAQIVAPFPKSSSRDYVAEKSRYDLFRRISAPNYVGSRSPSSPDVRKADADREERFIKEAREDASDAYDAFIAKLNSKVGNCISAELVGNHVWGYSILIVEKEDGSKEKWKTQQIINMSKYSKVFNQYPTRKVK